MPVRPDFVRADVGVASWRIPGSDLELTSLDRGTREVKWLIDGVEITEEEAMRILGALLHARSTAQLALNRCKRWEAEHASER